MEYKEFNEIKKVRSFQLGAHNVLVHTLEDFFGASVSLDFSPIFKYKTMFGVDIIKNPKRPFYLTDNPKTPILLVVFVEKEDTMYFLGIQVKSPLMRYLDTSIFNVSCSVIGQSLSEAAKEDFRSSYVSLFNESLAKRIMIQYIGRGKYDYSKLSYMTDMFLGLRSTTFEGKNFSTGLIITKSKHTFYKEEVFDKKGHFLVLADNRNMAPKICDKLNPRFWYLVDGFKSFYITDLKERINGMFIYEGTNDDYVGDMLLSKTLIGADILFRVNNGRELSIINSEGYEFFHQENKWKFRDYDALKKCVLERLPQIEGFYNELMQYVLECSKNDTSSIIWIPRELSLINDTVIEKTTNELVQTPISLKDPINLPIIKRLLSSDGATVIDQGGNIRYFGCIADLSKVEKGGIKGTGETAAWLLASNGMAIKISQDGPIKIFIEGIKDYIPF